MNQAVRFIRKNGKIIPIGAPGGAGHVARAATHALRAHRAAGVAVAGGMVARHGLGKKKAPTQIHVKKGLDALGMGLSVLGGTLAAATFSKGLKANAIGHGVGYALDVAGIAANAASVAGKGKTKERVEQGGRQEARNFILGNAVFIAGVVGLKENRKALGEYAAKGAVYGKKLLSLARSALRVAE